MKKNCMRLLIICICLLMSVQWLTAQVSLSAPEIGDVDENGVINIIDALKTAQYYVGTYPKGFSENLADVNADGTINILDALMIAQYYVGILASLPAAEKYREYQQQLDTAHLAWDKLSVDYYEYVYTRWCFCQDAGVPFNIQVKDNVILSVINGRTGKALDPKQAANFLTIDGLFDVVQSALVKKNRIRDLAFDPVYSYPAIISIDYLIGAVDDEISHNASGLRPLRTAVITSLPGEKLQLDPFVIEAAAVTGNILSLAIQYSGGCTSHEYILYAADTFMESYPVQLNCYLYHNGFNDMCDALITQPAAFDLTPIAELYEKMYLQRDTIILNLHLYYSGTPGKLIRLRFNPL